MSHSILYLSDLWNVYGECENFAVLKGHTGAVMEIHFSLDGRWGLTLSDLNPVSSFWSTVARVYECSFRGLQYNPQAFFCACTWDLTLSFLAWNNSLSTRWQSVLPYTVCFVVFYSTMFTASTDKTLGIWDYETGTRIKKLKGHSSFVNSCFPSRRGPQYIVSGADDCTVKVGCSSGCD